MEQLEVLGSLRADELLLAAASGFALGFGAVAAAGLAPAKRGALPVMLFLLILLAVLLIAFVFFSSAWAPNLIAAGLSLLAGPPVFQALFAKRRPRGAAAALFTFGAVALLAALIARRLFS